MPAPEERTVSVHVAVIGDIVESRSLPDRHDVQDRLRIAVSSLNERHAAVLAAPMAITGGDELKVILQDPALAVDIITGVSEELYPVRLAWGLGRGVLHTSWVPDVGALDGPCFHRAREAIDEVNTRDAWVGVKGFSSLDDRLLTTIFRLLGVLRSSWTEVQLAYVRAVRGASQKDVAREFDVTPGAVSQALRRARYMDVKEAETVLRDLLTTYRGDSSGPMRSGDPDQEIS